MTSYMLRMLRREDRRLLTSRCTISRGTYPDQVDVATDVPCLIRPAMGRSTSSEVEVVGAETVAVHVYDVKFRFDQDVQRDDVVTVTRTADPLLQGRWLSVHGVVNDEWLTSRIAVCTEDRGE